MQTADDDLAFATVDELSAGLSRGDVSHEALTGFFLERLATHGDRLNAVVETLPARATEQARRLDRQRRGAGGPLLGIPYGIKDMFSLVEGPPGNGSTIPLHATDVGDAALVTNLSGVGSVLCAKLALHEFGGLHCSDPARSVPGPTRNPWHLDRWAGGSSGGPGAAVAGGLVPFAIGAESGGSIAFPSSYCGVTGLRPTFGSVDRSGASVVCWSLDKLGPLAHSAADCRVIAAAVMGSTVPATGFATGPSSFRVGWASHDVEEAAVPEIRPALRDGLQAFRDLGGVLVEMELPTDVPYAEAIAVIAIGEAANTTRALLDAPGFANLTLEQQAGLIAGQDIRASDYLDADRVRTALERRFSDLFRRVDALASFVTPWPAPPIEQLFRGVPITGGLTGLILSANLLGLPAVFMPCGLSESGLPVGLQVVGPPGSEWRLLDVVEAVQRVTPWHRLRPPPEPAPPSGRVAPQEAVTPDALDARVASERERFAGLGRRIGEWAQTSSDVPAAQFRPAARVG
jgi:aspartyl-tRNA(Asn)/glutamyl-tRNA(Gln) amidotransferase subunit A